jgi:transcriptional antiterminator NusG
MTQENEEGQMEEQQENSANEQSPAASAEATKQDNSEESAAAEAAQPSESTSEPESAKLEDQGAAIAEEELESPPEPEQEDESEDTVPAAEAEPSESPAAETDDSAETGSDEKALEEAVQPAKATKDKVPTLPEEAVSDKKWFVIHAHSGHENKVKQSLENRVRQEQMEDLISQVLVPSEEVAEVKGGKKRITSRKIFPGYVLVEMKLTHKTWYLIRTTPGVTGFIGSGKMPIPLEPDEIETIFKQMRGEEKKPKPKVEFEKDERVKIIEGPFSNFMGTVDEVNPERGKLKVLVEIFERLTSVELEFWQVEKT